MMIGLAPLLALVLSAGARFGGFSASAYRRQVLSKDVGLSAASEINAPAHVEQTAGPPTWYKGNTHAHSNNSGDGNIPPEDLVAWYRDMGYDFLVLTDHNVMTDFAQYSSPDFLCINGEEITAPDNHVNGLGLSFTIPPGTIEQNVLAVLVQGGIPQLNHVSGWLLDASDILAVQALRHMEVYNDFLGINDEDIWDEVLSAGRLIYGLAVDDSHYFTPSPRGATPGGGWVVVRTDTLSLDSILGAIDAGDFYASTGIVLNDYVVDVDGMLVDSQNGEQITFIGQNGCTLLQVPANAALYLFQGTETYVRAVVTNSQGQLAWTQPVFFCPSDLNGNGTVDLSDLIDLLRCFGQPAVPPCDSPDIDNDGSVNVLDLIQLLLMFGQRCP